MKPGILFWDVDTQVDFIDPKGKLYVPGAEKIVPNLERLTGWARDHQVLVIASADSHQEGDEEFQAYPPHCLAGTPGQKKIPETQLEKSTTIPNRAVGLPSAFEGIEQIILEKQHFDVFTNPNTDPLLERLGKDFEIVLYGVVTEICVSRAARGLLERGYRIRVVHDAVHHLEEEKAQATFEEIERGGGRLVRTNEVVGA